MLKRSAIEVQKFVLLTREGGGFSPCAKRRTLAVLLALAFVFVLASLACAPARADVGVVLNESLDTSVARITGSGHTSVYFSRICPETPVKLRLCRAGELGSVMSNYTTLGEDEPFEWNIVPLSIYVYGIEEPQNRPLIGSRKIKRALEERYREKFLSEYCAHRFCRTSNNAEWREMVAATIERSIYVFVVSTTVEQDLELIAQFNSLPNVNHFNGVTRNCADFTRRVINTYFHDATRPDYLNDFGMTTPKAIARSFSHYADRHPELNFHVLHFAQLPGTIKRSSECRAGTEQLVHAKKLLVPMLIFADYGVPIAAASYALTGRFNPEHELEHYPSPEAAAIADQLKKAKSDKDAARIEQLKALRAQEREQIVGTPEEWKNYRNEFDSMAAEAVRLEIIPNHDYLNHLFKHLDKAGTPITDANGAIWMQVSENGSTTRVGLSASNVLSFSSDPRLAYALLLARTDRVIKSPKHSREILPEFQQDWSLLVAGRWSSGASLATTVPLAPSTPARTLVVSPADNHCQH